MIKVSIIVPVYKAEEYLSKCVESLISQTISDIEIILVDDGSPDNSGILCDKYAEKNSIIRVVHKKNGGVSSARNEGLNVAKGEYILFVDSDDWVEKDYVESLLTCKEKNPNYEIMCGFRTVSDYDGTLIANNVFSKDAENTIMFCDYMDLVQGWLAQSPVNKLFSKKVIDDGELRFDESLSLGEDMLFGLEYYDICGAEGVVCLNKPLYNYIRTGKESLDNKYYSDILEIDEKLYSKLKCCIVKWGADANQMDKYYTSRFYRFIYALDNTYRVQNKASNREKRKTNKNILKSNEFKNSLKNVKSYIHPIHKYAYKSGSWTMVQFAYKITSLKKLFRKK